MPLPRQMGARHVLACLIIAAVSLAPAMAAAQSHQVRATMAVTATVVSVCSIGVDVSPAPGCEAMVREHQWLRAPSPAPAVSLREVNLDPPLAGASPGRIVVRTIEF